MRVSGPEQEPEEDEVGEPIELLTRLRDSASAGFLSRIRHSIERRSLASQSAELWWTAGGAVFRAYLELLREILRPTNESNSKEK